MLDEHAHPAVAEKPQGQGGQAGEGAGGHPHVDAGGGVEQHDAAQVGKAGLEGQGEEHPDTEDLQGGQPLVGEHLVDDDLEIDRHGQGQGVEHEGGHGGVGKFLAAAQDFRDEPGQAKGLVLVGEAALAFEQERLPVPALGQFGHGQGVAAGREPCRVHHVQDVPAVFLAAAGGDQGRAVLQEKDHRIGPGKKRQLGRGQAAQLGFQARGGGDGAKLGWRGFGGGETVPGGQGFVGQGQAVVAAYKGQGAQSGPGQGRDGDDGDAAVAFLETFAVDLEGARGLGQGVGHADDATVWHMAHAQHHHAVAVGKDAQERKTAQGGHGRDVQLFDAGGKPRAGSQGEQGVEVRLGRAKAETVGGGGRVEGQAVGVGHGLEAGQRCLHGLSSPGGGWRSGRIESGPV